MIVATGAWHLAQANVARMRGNLDDPVMAGFVARLDPLNAVADASPGFVWRYVSEEGDTTEAEVFDDELVLFNLSVWQSVEALEEFAYKSDHIEALRKRLEWFERSSRSSLVLWWLEAGHIPTVQEAKDRFDRIWDIGPSPAAFNFRHRFAPPDTAEGHLRKEG